MRKHIIILILTALVLSCCASTPVSLYVHRTESDDGDIFGYPRNAFFYNRAYSNEITKYKIKFNPEEYKEIHKLLEILKTRPDLDDLELGEGPTDTALVIGKDTLYTYGIGKCWLWKRKAYCFESPILKKALEKYRK